MKRMIVLGPLVLAIAACIAALLWLWDTGPKSSAKTRFALSESRMVQGPVAPPGAPAVSDVLYEPISPQTAAQINRAVPLQAAGPPARPFRLEMGSQTWDRAATCLTQAIYYEAASEPADGKRAVAQVVLNRVPHLLQRLVALSGEGSAEFNGVNVVTDVVLSERVFHDIVGTTLSS